MPRILSDNRDPAKLKLGQEIRKMQKEEPEKLAEFLGRLSEEEAEEIMYDQEIWARESQWIDLSDGFPITLFLGARGSGKGYAGASTIKRGVERHGITKILIIVPVARDIRANIAPSIIDMYPDNHPNKPYWSPSKASIIWPNGAVAVCIPAEAGEDAVRGLNNEYVFVDELMAFDEGIVTQALLTLRLPPSKMFISTSPIAHPMIIDLHERSLDPDNKYVKLIRGTTYDNMDNLSETFIQTVIKAYEGTRLGDQELLGELILSNDAALWQNETITRNTISKKEMPEFTKIAIGLDPAMLATKSNSKGRQPDKTGIVVVGLTTTGLLCALEGHTSSYTAEGWVNKVADLYDKYSQFYPVKVVAEINIIGKEMMTMAFRNGGKDHMLHSINSVFATQSKIQRASPFSLLSEQDKIKFVEGDYLKLLTMELTTFTGKTKDKSPDSMDAFVWACSELKPARKKFTKSYELLI